MAFNCGQREVLAACDPLQALAKKPEEDGDQGTQLSKKFLKGLTGHPFSIFQLTICQVNPQLLVNF